MTDWKLPWEGGCFCGNVRYKVTKPPLLTLACHCEGCQNMTASAYSLNVAVSPDGFELTRGDLVLGALHGPVQQCHCDNCKAWVVTKPPGAPFYNLKAATLDDHSWFVPFVDMQLAEGYAWAKTPAQHGFDGFPKADDFRNLVAAFPSAGIHPA